MTHKLRSKPQSSNPPSSASQLQVPGHEGGGPSGPGGERRSGDRGSLTQDSSYDSNAEEEEEEMMMMAMTTQQQQHPPSFSSSDPHQRLPPQEHLYNTSASTRGTHFKSKIGMDMPNSADLKAAVESCDALCRFALHYSNQAEGRGSSSSSSSSSGASRGEDWRYDGGTLDPDMKASLQKIRTMNTAMLIGLQNANDGGGDKDGVTSLEAGDESMEREMSPVRFGHLRYPPYEMVHEMAKAATSIFQLAIRIKSWIGMTSEERVLEEEINTIRGKRCPLKDNALTTKRDTAATTVDQNGKPQVQVENNWTVVPTASSAQNLFYVRQRNLEQHRPMSYSVHDGSHHGQKQQLQQQQQRYQDQTSRNHEQPSLQSVRGSGEYGRNGMDVDPEDRDSTSGTTMKSATSGMHRSGSHGNTGHSGQGLIRTITTSTLYSSVPITLKSHRRPPKVTGTNGHASGNSSESGRTSKNGGGNGSGSGADAPYQKYRKRAKRTQPPGRCLSCDSSDTPEWRRGPDGARTLCNACGLHYAKLLKRQNEQNQQQHRLSAGPPSVKKGLVPSNARMEQLQAIAFSKRQSVEPTSGGSSESSSYLINSDVHAPEDGAIMSSSSPLVSEVSLIKDHPMTRPSLMLVNALLTPPISDGPDSQQSSSVQRMSDGGGSGSVMSNSSNNDSTSSDATVVDVDVETETLKLEQA
ncbi:hypothetical protein EDD11_004788 [Mortierella claussenii]|nr:hypothetical protein EDD11_004788 [Mortierella claussenii]